MRHTLIAGISVLALGACASTGAPVETASPTQAQTLAPASNTFSLITDAELTADMPHLASGGDAKAYTAAFIHWVLTPGHMIERSRMLATGSPPDLADASAFSSLVRELDQDGDAEATIFKVIGSADDISVLGVSDHPTARFFLQTRRLHQGSLFERIDALTWLRKEAVTNKDAAFALGGFLIDQGATQDYLGSSRLLATPAEISEGTNLLKGVAAHTTLESLIHIADLLEDTLDTPQGDPVALRNLLEITVGATSTTLEDTSASTSTISQELGNGSSGLDATYQAASMRIALAELLEVGKGGPVDIERAKTFYMEAAKATQDTSAIRALKRLGVDVSAYDTPDDSADKPTAPRDDGWEDE